MTGWNAQLVIEPQSKNGIFIVTNSDNAYYLTYALMEQWSENTLGKAVRDSQMAFIQNQVYMVVTVLLLLFLVVIIIFVINIKKGKLVWEPQKYYLRIVCISTLIVILGMFYYMFFYTDLVFFILFDMHNNFLYTFLPPTIKYINLELFTIGITIIVRSMFRKVKMT